MVRTAILLIFFVSGAIALGYQVLWSKLLLDFIGVSAYSYAVVLASFMGGLSIGSRLFGKLADRVRSPLMLYAYQEFFLGAYALVYSPLTRLAEGLYAEWAARNDTAPESVWIKLMVSSLLLLPPTIAMGGTFPALMKHVTNRLADIGKNASRLYAINAFGAVCGILLMTFYLMPSAGMFSSLRILAISNFALATLAYLLSKIHAKTIAEPHPAGSGEEVAAISRGWIQTCLILIFAEGFVAFVYEIAWTRYFGLVLGSSTYSFSIMLASLISGITAGSALFSALDHRIKNPLVFFGWSQLLCSAAVMMALPMYPYLPWLFQQYGAMWSFERSAFYSFEIGKSFLCFLIMLPPGVFIGMALPAILKTVGASLQKLGTDTGRVYSWNTWGNVLGAVLGSLILLPFFGMERVLVLAALSNLAIAWAAFMIRPRARILPVALTVCMIAFVFLRTGWNPAWFTLSPMHRAGTADTFKQVEWMISDVTIPLFKEDPAANLIIRKDPVPGGEYVSLFINGKADASTGDMATQVLLAHVPLMFHPDPRSVLTIGLASGATAGSVLAHPVERSDVVEIVRSMPEATRYFDSLNRNPLSDARTRLIIDDARTYLAYTNRKYDVVISEPSNPWMAGLGGLFSDDFYRKAAAKLNPGGIYLQWVHLYNMSNGTFAVIVRTFRKTFPFIYAFQGSAGDLLLLGSQTALKPDWNAMMRRLETPAIRTDLRRIGIEDLSQFLYLQRFSPGSLLFLAARTDRENNDDNHFVEYRAPRDLFLSARVDAAERFDERLSPSHALFWTEFVGGYPHDPLNTLRFLSTRRITIPSVLQAYRMALTLPGAEVDLAKRIPNVEAVDRSAILTMVILSPEKRAFWLQQSEAWTTGSPEFRKLRIELLVAGGQSEQGIHELLQWIHSSSPPPAEWAVLRTAQWCSTAVLKKVVETYLQQQPSPFLRNLTGLL